MGVNINVDVHDIVDVDINVDIDVDIHIKIDVDMNRSLMVPILDGTVKLQMCPTPSATVVASPALTPSWHAQPVAPHPARVGALPSRAHAAHVLRLLPSCGRVAQARDIKGKLRAHPVAVAPTREPPTSRRCSLSHSVCVLLARLLLRDIKTT